MNPPPDSPTNERIKAEIREGLLILAKYQYGWGPQHIGLPLRPDVYSYVFDQLCRFGETVFDFSGVPFPEMLMDERGCLILTWAGRGQRSLELTIPCHDVIIARQKFDGSDTVMEGRLSADFEELLEQLHDLREWLRGLA